MHRTTTDEKRMPCRKKPGSHHHQSCKLVADVALQESLNNVLERMHGSIREREKLMRGRKVDDTPIIPMNQIYYNFIRPHQALDGKTPAEAAGVGIEGKGDNKWITLIQNASQKTKSRATESETS
jgi:hypothetical protein